MNVISIGSDKKIFEAGSAVRARQIEYGRLCDKLELIVVTRGTDLKSEQISDHVRATATNSKIKIGMIFDAYKTAQKIVKESGLNPAETVVTAQDPFESGLAAFLIARKFGMKLHLQIHTDLFSRYFGMSSAANFIRVFFARFFLLKQAGGIRVVSERIKRSLASLKLAAQPAVLPIYTDIAALAAAEPAFDLHEKYPQFETIVLMLSRLEPEKKIDFALNVFADVLKKNPKAGLVIVGEGSQKEKLSALASELGIAQSVAFEPWTNDTLSYYKTCDVFLLTSSYEGYGLSLLEAAASGAALVCSDAGIAGDILTDGITARICAVGDTQAFTADLADFLSDARARALFGEKAKETVLAGARSKEEYLALYKKSWQDAVHTDLDRILRVIRYIIAGATAAFTDIFSLYILKEHTSLSLAASVAGAFLIGFAVSFLFQKFWTFKDSSLKDAHKQAAGYFAVAAVSFFLNVFFVRLLAEDLHVWYILAKIIVSGSIAFGSFFIYRLFIFRQQ